MSESNAQRACKHSVDPSAKLLHTEMNNGRPFDSFQEQHRYPTQSAQDERVGQLPAIALRSIGEDNFNDSEDENPPTMDSISSFLETMHAKNLTLKKLAKVQQRRIDELAHENKALRQASEMKDDEIRKNMEHLNKIRDATGDVGSDLSEPETKSKSLKFNRSKLEEGCATSSATASRQKAANPSDKPGSSATSRTSGKPPTTAGRKTSIVVSHKVAVRRVMHLVRKINGACNKRGVGLYTLVSCMTRAALPLLIGSPRETILILDCL